MLATLLVFGLGLSHSKISLQLLDDRYTPGAKAVVAAGPRVLKLFDLGNGMREALRDYKSKNPDGLIVVRIWTTKKWKLSDNPVEAGKAYWREVLWPPLRSLPIAERRMVDLVEGPNEGDCTPTFATVDDAKWYGAFSASLVEAMAAAGFRPLVGNIAVGNPGGTPEETTDKIAAFLPAFEAAKKANGAWGYHGYTINYSKDLEKERWYSLRYRMIHEIMTKLRPEIADLPLVLTEGGVDFSGNAQKDGWRGRGTLDQFTDWLAWYDKELQKDRYVVGVTLFQSGGTLWPSFETEPVTPWIARHLNRQRP